MPYKRGRDSGEELKAAIQLAFKTYSFGPDENDVMGVFMPDTSGGRKRYKRGVGESTENPEGQARLEGGRRRGT